MIAQQLQMLAGNIEFEAYTAVQRLVSIFTMAYISKFLAMR